MSTCEYHDQLIGAFGFANRWTAKLFSWLTTAVAFGEFELSSGQSVGDLADTIHDYFVHARRIPEYRLRGVDFGAIAMAIMP